MVSLIVLLAGRTNVLIHVVRVVSSIMIIIIVIASTTKSIIMLVLNVIYNARVFHV